MRDQQVCPLSRSGRHSACARMPSWRARSPPRLCGLIGSTSTPNDEAMAWITPNCPLPTPTAGSRRTATRFTPGATSLSSSSHFAAHAEFELGKSGDIAARPRQARDELWPTGSVTCFYTIGTVRVARCNGPTTELAPARMRSGASATNSVAYRRGALRIARAPAGVDPQIVAVSPTRLLQRPLGTPRGEPELPDRPRLCS